ncbi:MAG: glutamate--tRNA ligase, partial [Acutalibacteraceae bacterium]
QNFKENNKNPSDFKGHVGDVSTVIRIAITSRVNTPDLHAIMSLLGKEKVMSRLELAKNTFEEEF